MNAPAREQPWTEQEYLEFERTAGERHEFVDGRIVPDDHHRFSLIGQTPKTRHDLVRRGPIELTFDPDVSVRVDQLERLTRATRRGAQHQRDLNLRLAQVCPHELCRPASPRRKRAVVIGPAGIIPTRFRVTQQQQKLGLRHPLDRPPFATFT